MHAATENADAIIRGTRPPPPVDANVDAITPGGEKPPHIATTRRVAGPHNAGTPSSGTSRP